ncbi:hypothetical protein K439DRAFT_1647402 [Ramaria rubella]|nr:hypothetical protein K439DRAFT_1647402 [Ramaria rubella]
MLAFLRLYATGEGTSWAQASLLAATASGKGRSLACSLHKTHLPVSLYGAHVRSWLADEDLAEELQLHLQSLNKRYLGAADERERTARHWMHIMQYRYGKTLHRMYDIVEYRTHIFLPLMMTWTHENTPSTFYANDQRKTRWVHITEKAEPVRKGEGASIMVSDFYSPDLGWLKSKDGSCEARILFKAGKNRDGYFDCEDFCKQTELAIELFEDNFPGTAVAAFGFNNAPGHQKRADDALSAHHMPKFQKIWLGGKGTLPSGEPQSFYFSDNHPTMTGWFKGMKIIIKLALIELVESHGHIAFFYPKFHCKLNFIEQCWGASKYQYQQLPPTANEAVMMKNIKICLDSVDIIKIQRFIHAYQSGLNASWANKKYHGHRVLPESILRTFDINPQ